eukprot:scaffold3784_cov174-Amphora_coffeaeformis.AAC.5
MHFLSSDFLAGVFNMHPCFENFACGGKMLSIDLVDFLAPLESSMVGPVSQSNYSDWQGPSRGDLTRIVHGKQRLTITLLVHNFTYDIDSSRDCVGHSTKNGTDRQPLIFVIPRPIARSLRYCSPPKPFVPNLSSDPRWKQTDPRCIRGAIRANTRRAHTPRRGRPKPPRNIRVNQTFVSDNPARDKCSAGQ